MRGSASVGVGMLLQFVASMCVIVWPVITEVLMRVFHISLVRVHMLVLVIMLMAVCVGVFVTVGFASMGVFV
jgi:hypothetical protein